MRMTTCVVSLASPVKDGLVFFDGDSIELSATVGASRLAQIADALEIATKVMTPDPAEVGALLPSLTDTYERTANALLHP